MILLFFTAGHSDDEVTPSLVSYEDRLLYASLVERVRMHESKLQVRNVQMILFYNVDENIYFNVFAQLLS